MRYSIILLIASTTLFSCVQKQSNNEKAINNELATIIDSLKIELNDYASLTSLPGFAVGIVSKEGLIYSDGFGFSDIENQIRYGANTIQPIGSISKIFVGVALMKLVDLGKLDLDEPINDIFPYEIKNPNHPNEQILVRHLATHTSSIDDFDEGNNDSEHWLLEDIPYKKGEITDDLYLRLEYFNKGKERSIEEAIKNAVIPEGIWYSENNFSKEKPGSKVVYSNLGTTIAARIIELRSEMAFDEFTKKYIFEPLKMNDTYWFYQDIPDTKSISNHYYNDKTDGKVNPLLIPKFEDCTYPSSRLKLSIDDMSLYLVEMIRGFNGQGTIISKNAYTVLFKGNLTPENHFEEESEHWLNDAYNYGIFWARSYPGYILHKGGIDGVYTLIYYNPETELGVTAITNAQDEDFGGVIGIIRKYEKKIGNL